MLRSLSSRHMSDTSPCGTPFIEYQSTGSTSWYNAVLSRPGSCPGNGTQNNTAHSHSEESSDFGNETNNISTSPISKPVTKLKRPFSRLRNGECATSDHIAAVPSQSTMSTMRQKRKKFINSLSAMDIRKKTCCEKRCFWKTDIVFLRHEAGRVLLWNREERRKYLLSMLQANKKVYYFSGRPVCYRFLEYSFKFSRHLQSSVKKSAEEGTSVLFKGARRDAASPQRDAIICFLDRLASSTADDMPDRAEKHLPLFQKRPVYEMFCDQYDVLYPGKAFPTLSYFYTTWKKYCSHIKVRRIHRFMKCSECEYLRDHLERIGTDSSRTAPLLERRKLHIEMVSRERREYQKKCEQAALFPSRFTSLIVDGADQSSYGLPHFIVNTKAVVGHSLKVKLIGVLEHGVQKHLSLYTMTAEFESGANHIIEALHRTLTRKAMGSKLQGTLFVQVDNCTRENKNRFLFCYLECLVAWGVFLEVQVSFLPIGHTHADIDQAFSCTSRRLHCYNAATMDDLIGELRLSYTPEPSVCRMNHVANFSGLCTNENSIGKVHAFSKYRYFKFFRSESSDRRTGWYNTACNVKLSCDDEWEPLPTITLGLKGFTLVPPDLKVVPPTVLKSPPDRDEVMLRLRAEETRVNSTSKMMQLHALIEQVYSNRDDPFHWNLHDCFELNGVYRNQVSNRLVLHEEDEISNACSAPLTDLPYSVNRFVSVNGEGCTTDMPFWLGQIKACEENGEGVIKRLSVRWYEVYDKGNVWTGKYRPAVIRKRNRAVPWESTISVDTVIAEFASLTNKRIRVGVEKEIRAGLASMLR